jgi:hypothetical protein
MTMKLETIVPILVIVALLIFAVILTHDAMVTFKPPLDSCDHLTNATYDNYSNSEVCRFNGTGWEPMFGNKGIQFRGNT